MGTFKHKTHGQLKAAFPAIEAVIGIGPVIAVLAGVLNPIIAFFEILLFLVKLALFIAMLPLLAIAFLSKMLTDAIDKIFKEIGAFAAKFKGINKSAGLSQYKFHGKVGHFGAAATAFFKDGLPGIPPDPTRHVYGVFLFAVNTTGLSGIKQMFGPPPEIPELPPASAPVNIMGGDKDHPAASLTFAPGRQVGHWTNNVNENAYYQLRIEDVTLTKTETPAGAATPKYHYIALQIIDHALTTGGHDTTKEYIRVVTKHEFGTSHHFDFDDPGEPFIEGHQYSLWVSLVDKDGNLIAQPGDAKSLNPTVGEPTTYTKFPSMPPRPTPAPPGPLGVPVSDEITFQAREGLYVALPGLGFLADAITGLEDELKVFQALIMKTLGRFQEQKDGIDAMFAAFDAQIKGLHDGVTWLQGLLQKFASFTLHFGGALEVGEIWIYRYEGPIGEMGAAMTPILSAGLDTDGTGPTQIVECEFILAEDIVTEGILKFLTGGD